MVSLNGQLAHSVSFASLCCLDSQNAVYIEQLLKACITILQIHQPHNSCTTRRKITEVVEKSEANTEEMKKNPSKEVVAGNKETSFKPKISNFASVIPAKRRSVQRMIFDSMVQSMASVFHPLSKSKSNDAATKKTNIIFPDPSSS